MFLLLIRNQAGFSLVGPLIVQSVKISNSLEVISSGTRSPEKSRAGSCLFAMESDEGIAFVRQQEPGAPPFVEEPSH